jgi:CRISPR system Cascade subunit CasD
MRWLVFTYRAPMAAFGEVAGGSFHGSRRQPTRSGLLGLISGCLGIDRRELDRILTVEAGYGVGVRTDDAGTSLVDFQTTRVPVGVRARGRATRGLELEAGRITNIVTRREYICDAQFTVVVWPRDGAPYSLEQIADALRMPKFVPFAGRASCIFSQPFMPQIVEADTIDAALSQRPSLLETTEPATLHCDTDCPIGVTHHAIEVWRDRRVAARGWIGRDVRVATLG